MILVKTPAGQQVLRDRSVHLTPRQRSAFILFDGRRSIPEVMHACAGVVDADIGMLLAQGLLAPAPSGAEAAARTPLVAAEASARDPRHRYMDAYPVAMRLAGSLGLRGFRLNLAIEGATSFDELAALAPRIRAAVGSDRAAELYSVLGL